MAVAPLCDAAVLYVTHDQTLREKVYDIVVENENEIPTVRVYFSLPSSRFLAGLAYNIRFWIGYYKGWKTIKRIWGTPDIVHANVVERAGFIALALKRFKGIEYVVTEHSTPDIAYVKGHRTSTRFPFRRLKKIIYRESGCSNVDSNASLSYLQKVGIDGNLCVIPNVVETDPRFLNMASRHENDGRFIATHISILNERKNVADIIRVFQRLYYDRNKHQIELHIIGEGVQKRQLEELARTLEVLDRCVFFHGFVSQEEKLRRLTASDVHVLNSSEEGFSVVTAEAISYGVPVIATRCGGPEDFVTSETGILIDRDNPEQLFEALLSMIEGRRSFNRTTLQTFGRSRFSPDAVGAMTYAMYESAIWRWHAGNTHKMLRIDPSWRVLDVGSGHQPNRRANVILEKYMEGTIHRTTQAAVVPGDKQLVIGDALAMPFPDKAFDYAIASHIAEHVDDPLQFCAELSRAARHGYIETPGPLTEYLMPTPSHKWIVSKRNGGLHFRKNTVTRSAWPAFFRFFYLNRDGYVGSTLRSTNPVVKALNTLLLLAWKVVPFAYTRLEWNDKIQCTQEK
ncbi:MAG: glycosyltransferase [Acidobacteriota bacterium]